MTDDERPGEEGGEASINTGPSLSLDETLGLLSNRERRTLLAYLREEGDRTLTFDEVVDHLVAQRSERIGEQTDRDHVARSLHHVHVPKLAEAGVVEYDTQDRTIRYRPDSRLETWLERIRAEDDRA